MIKVVTTCNAKGFADYGFQMLRGFIDLWPQSVELLFYAEDFTYEKPPANVQIRALPQWFDAWKASHTDRSDAHGLDRSKNRPGRDYDYRRDCVKFAHKVAALTDASDKCDLLIWIDADTLTHAAITEEWLHSLFPGKGYMAWLDRVKVYPECGFMMFRPGMECHEGFMRRLRSIYESNRVFKMAQTHDSFVIQQIVNKCVNEALFPAPHSLSGRARVYHHVFPHSRLGERLDHAKGALKEIGRTPKSRLEMGRPEAHWS